MRLTEEQQQHLVQRCVLLLLLWPHMNDDHDSLHVTEIWGLSGVKLGLETV